MKTKISKNPIIFNMTADQCVWSSAGVIKPTACMNAFNCLSCPVDRKMQNIVKKQRLSQGPGRNLPPKLKTTLKRSPDDRQCRHMLSGRVVLKMCMYDFNCPSCNFHQMMEDENMNANIHPVPTETVAGFEVAKHYYYHLNHTWARVEYGGRVRVGLDDFSTRLTGELDQISLPDLGRRIQSGESCIGVKRNRFSMDLVSPVDGVVVSKNPSVSNQPGLLNHSPYGDGWLLVIEPLRLKVNLKKLYFGAKSISWMEDESSRLSGILSEQTEFKMAATGGQALPDIFKQLPEALWDSLAQNFLSPV